MHSKKYDIVYLIFCITTVLFVIYAFTGNWMWEANPYNSYTLQALSWLDGRLDLGKNYSHLELAIYKEKYFVSFPPFPSYFMLPFAIIFKAKTPDGVIAFFVTLIGAVYGYRLICRVRKSSENAVFMVLFLYVGTNALSVMVNGWVWFIAQNICFTLSIMALFYAEEGKGGLSLFLWGCSVGCRPLQIIYLPVLLFILCRKLKEEFPEDSIFGMIKKNYIWVVPVTILALSYMILNYLRFGNILEFGHNYLPEFVKSQHGQFNVLYIKEHISNLFRLPFFNQDGKIQFYPFDGTAFWLVSPIFISYFIFYISVIFNKKEKTYWLSVNHLVLLCIFAHFIMLMSHKTMGGWHFGNRYTNDTLPYLFYGLICLMPKEQRSVSVHNVLFLIGLLINVVGIISFYGSGV